MIYITFNLNPCPCISVSDTISPHEIDFKLLVVACPTFGFLVLALPVIPTIGAVSLIAGFGNLFQAVSVPLKIFCSFFYRSTLKHILMRRKCNDFWTCTF